MNIILTFLVVLFVIISLILIIGVIIMATVGDIQTAVSELSTQLDVVAALVAQLKAAQGVATQEELDSLLAAIEVAKQKALAIS